MNQSLREELLAMREKDISARTSLVERGELGDTEYHPEMRLVHEVNNKKIRDIIEKYGWPLESQVGEDGSEAAWLVVQHAVLEPEFQEECINLLKEAVERGEAKGWQLAYLQDRVLVRQGKLQLYGTQHEAKDGLMGPLPTENPAEVNVRRAALDIWTQEEHTGFLQKDYDKIQSNKASGGDLGDR